MVRAGAVTHPSEWTHCGYNEIVEPVSRYRVIDNKKVVSYFGFQKEENFLVEYRERVVAAVSKGEFHDRDDRWSEAVAVGNKGFLEGIRDKLGIKVKDRTVEHEPGKSCLKEPGSSYEGVFGIENGALRGENSRLLKSI
jgi:putative transposase